MLERDISAKEPYISSKEPYISAKEPYISKPGSNILGKRTLQQKGPINPPKRPIFRQKRHTHTHIFSSPSPRTPYIPGKKALFFRMFPPKSLILRQSRELSVDIALFVGGGLTLIVFDKNMCASVFFTRKTLTHTYSCRTRSRSALRQQRALCLRITLCAPIQICVEFAEDCSVLRQQALYS